MAMTVVASSVMGGYHRYSPVPLWDDMWNGYIEFYLKLLDGDNSGWLSQHNEHRILLSRFLFWIDIHFFAGTQVFLLLVNYLLASLLLFSLWCIWKTATKQQPYWFGWFLIIWGFSWIQFNNLTWCFQSQFWLAQLLPLQAFYCLYLSLNKERYFYLALGLGILSIFSMANGIFALPLMVIFSLFTRSGLKKSLILAVLSVLCISGYFYQYQPGNYGHLSKFLDNPWPIFQYVGMYLGGPFYYFLGKNEAAKIIATLLGLSLIVASLIIFIGYLRAKEKQPLLLTLLIIMAFLGAGAFATASGRITIGLDLALSSRYMTPALMAWSVLGIMLLMQPRIQRVAKKPISIVFFVALSLMVLKQQYPTKYALDNYNSNKKVGILALEMGVYDQEKFKLFYHQSTEQLIKIANPAKQRDIAIFGTPPFKDLSTIIGSRINLNRLTTCDGNIESIKPMAEHQQVSGWIYDKQHQKIPTVIYFVNQDNVIVGAALSGYHRPEIAAKLGKNARLSGYQGYINMNHNRNLRIYAPESSCKLNIVKQL